MKNVKNRENVKQHHTTGSRSYIAHYEHVVSISTRSTQLLSYLYCKYIIYRTDTQNVLNLVEGSEQRGGNITN